LRLLKNENGNIYLLLAINDGIFYQGSLATNWYQGFYHQDVGKTLQDAAARAWRQQGKKIQGKRTP
jgi:hypothetical protein